MGGPGHGAYQRGIHGGEAAEGFLTALCKTCLRHCARSGIGLLGTFG